jgi:diguanylate cyclase (GGDEF)-like protein
MDRRVGEQVSGQRPAIAPRWIHIGWPLAVIVFTVGYVGMPGLAGDIVFLIGNLVPVVAILISSKIYPLTYKVPWYLAGAGLILMAVPNVAWIIQVDLQGQQATHPLVYIALSLGHLTLLSGSISVVLRHAPTDPGGVMHAALVGLGLSGPIWEVLLHPRLVAGGVPSFRQGTLLIIVIALMTLLGTILRVMKTTVEARANLYYFLLAMGGGMAAVIATALTAGPERTTATLLAESVWFTAYFGCAAAALHPSVVDLTTPQGEHPDDLSARRLLSTAAVLSMPALTAAVTLAVGGYPDVLLLIVSTLACIPLLLVRFWNLAVRRLKAEEALAHQASHDELTGLPNRRTLMEEVDKAMQQLHAGAISSVAVLFCDLDGFKPINDTLGHQAGDEVLRVVAQRLRGCLRGTDVVGRLGGDEFLIVCAGLGEQSISSLQDRIRRSLAEPIQVQDKTCVVGTSIGVALTTDAEDASADSLIAESDQAMYVIKQSRGTARRAA